MGDACSIRRPVAQPYDEIDPVTGDVLQASEAGPVYAGKCLLQKGGYRADDRERAGADVAKTANVLSIPWNVDLRVGDEVTMTSSTDPTLVGRVFTVRDVTRTSILVWRQATVEQVETAHGQP